MTVGAGALRKQRPPLACVCCLGREQRMCWGSGGAAKGARRLPHMLHPQGLLTQQEASREAAWERALSSTKCSPNQPENPSEGLLRAVPHYCCHTLHCCHTPRCCHTPHCRHPALLPLGMRSRQSIPPESGASTEPCSDADGTITGGF